MRGILLYLLFCGCATKDYSKKPLEIKEEKDWVKIYEHELEVAKKNEDYEAWMFFWPEYLKERERSRRNK